MRKATYHGYKVFESGQVFNHRGRQIHGGFNNRGYRQVHIIIDGVRHSPTLHSLIMALFVGPRPTGAEINHKDGNKTNNALSNLEYCTPQENIRHSIALGLKPPSTVRGSNHILAKLTEEDVKQIRRRLNSKDIPTQIARDHGVSSDLIYRIRDRKAWGWLQ